MLCSFFTISLEYKQDHTMLKGFSKILQNYRI